jgi:hypothetical protein
MLLSRRVTFINASCRNAARIYFLNAAMGFGVFFFSCSARLAFTLLCAVRACAFP